MIFQCPQVYTYVYFHYNIQAQYQHIENQNFRLLLANILNHLKNTHLNIL